MIVEFFLNLNTIKRGSKSENRANLKEGVKTAEHTMYPDVHIWNTPWSG